LSEPGSEVWDDDKLAEFESSGDHLFTEGGHVVLVGVADLLDQTVSSESFEQTRYLTGAGLRQTAAQRFVLETADIELAADDGTEQVLIVAVEQVEAGVAAAFPGTKLSA
jgi:hypothetical protein